MFLQGGIAAGVSSVSFQGLFSLRALGDEIHRTGRRCILLWLCGAPSQFETWDPKPGKRTSGPFGAIPTSLPGVYISELMPNVATIMHKLAVVRSMSTQQSEHSQAIGQLTKGHAPRPPFERPILGSVLAQQLGNLESNVPQFVLLDPCPEGNEFKGFKAKNWAGWLGADYSPVRAGGDYGIPYIQRPELLDEADHSDREALRKLLSKKYENEKRSAAAASYNTAFQRVQGLMSCAPLFDMNRLPEQDRARYGPGAFGLHCLQALHLIENGCPSVMVANGMPWDCHVLNHEIHQMLVPELDRVIYHLINDLEQRGLLDETLVIMMGEFGRTPWLNDARGRDHYPNAWSLAMAGCGIRPGVVYGETDAEGFGVKDNPVNEGSLFATIFSALDIDPHAEYDLPGLPTFHRVENEASPIHEILL